MNLCWKQPAMNNGHFIKYNEDEQGQQLSWTF